MNSFDRYTKLADSVMFAIDDAERMGLTDALRHLRKAQVAIESSARRDFPNGGPQTYLATRPDGSTVRVTVPEDK